MLVSLCYFFLEMEDDESDYSGSDQYNDDDDDYCGYDLIYDDVDVSKPVDPEYFDFKLLTVETVEKLFNESVESLNNEMKVNILNSCFQFCKSLILLAILMACFSF